MSEHTPTTENIRQTFAYVRAGLDHDDGYPFVMEFHVEAFDRWLAEHDREAKAEAWEEAMAHATKTCRREGEYVTWDYDSNPYQQGEN